MRAVLERVLPLPFVVWAVVTFTFVALRLIPGDPALSRASQALTAEQIERFRAQWGLDQPMWKQYLAFAGEVVHGSLGRSLTSGQPVVDLIGGHFPATIEPALLAAIVGLVFGVLLGVIAALDHGRFWDQAIRLLSSTFFSIPWFWFALILVIVFAVNLKWLPVSGSIDASYRVDARTHFLTLDTLLAGQRDAFWDVIQHLILPALALSLFMVGYLARVMRAQVLEVLDADFVRTGRGKGLPRPYLIARHVLPNALLPVITVFGIQFGQLLAGAVIIERVFARQGLGTLLLQGIIERDYPVVQGTIVVVTCTYVLINVVVDALYAVIDPRTRRV
jgi:peptide/nickel transport system permease protein